MVKGILISLFVVPALISYGQSKNQKKLEKLFLEQYCPCLDKDPSLEPEIILYKTSSECILAFQKANAELINKIIREDYPKNTSISVLDRFNDSGKRMARNTAVPFMRTCEFYRTVLTKYKAGMIYQLGVTQENARKSIKELIEKEHSVKDPRSLALYYAVLGVMHEYVNDKKGALSYYDKALRQEELTAVKGLRELLILNSDVKPDRPDRQDRGTNQL